jgi:alanine racemase
LTHAPDQGSGRDPLPPLRPTFLIVDLDILAANVRELRRLASPKAELMTVIKADAYGNGLLEAAPVCLASGADQLGVATFDEAIALRRAGITAPVQVIGYTAAYQAAEVVRQGIGAAVFAADVAAAYSEAARAQNRPALLHLKVDTGMSRLGIWPDDSGLALAERIARLPGIELEGVFSHFASADEPDRTFTNEQFERFMGFCDRLAARGISFRRRHIANSAALLDHPETHLDMVRPGVLISGVWPSDDVQRRGEFRETLTLVTHAGMVKELGPGRRVSYGGTYVTPGPTTLATLPLGYHDGYKRGFSNKASMLVRGERAPIRGRVCMDQTMIDVSAVAGGVEAGEPVVALGRYGDEVISAAELGGLLGTIGYEVITTFGKRVPRLYAQSGRPVKVATMLGSWAVRDWQDLHWPSVEATYLATRP